MTGPGPSGFGELLRAWRERAMLTQEELGRRAGLDPRTLRRWESGESVRPHGRSLRLVADILALDDDESAALVAAARGATTSAATATSAMPDRPHQLPSAPSHFVGRREELDALRTHVVAGRSVIVVDGMAGVGKTAFAVQAGRLLSPEFPDGQLYLDLHGFSDRTRPLDPREGLARMMRALGVPGDQLPAEVEECAALFRSLVADRRLLFVYDNVAYAGQVAPLLPATPGCQVLTTSRHGLAGLDRGATIRLGILPPSTAVELFARAAELSAPPEAGSELTEVAELCGRLPLALRIAAARLRSRPSWRLTDLVGRLREQRAAVLDRPDDQTLGVSAALDLSYAALDEPIRRAYRMLGLVPGPDLDAGAAAALFATDLAVAGAALESLQDLHLLDEAPAGRYSFHDLTRSHAARLVRAAEAEGERSEALVRLIDHYRAWASAAMDIAHPYTRSRRPDPPYSVDSGAWTVEQAIAWLDTELPNILACARAARELELHHYGMDLAGIVHRRLITRHQLGEAELLHQMALQSAEDLGDRAATARAHRDLGRVRRHQHDYPEAAHHFDRALSLAAPEGLTTVQVDAHLELAAIVRHGASSVDPDEHFQRALRLAQQAGDDLGQLEYHSEIAAVRLLSDGDYRSAAHHFDQALTLARRLGHRGREAGALIGRGLADAQLGRPSAAIDEFRRAVVLSRREGIPVGELAGLTNLGHAVRRGGDPSAALVAYRDVLMIAQRTGDLNWQYEAHQGMGRAYADLGDGRSALDHHTHAQLLAEHQRMRVDLARAEDGLGDAHAILGDRAKARRHWQTALTLLTELGAEHTDDPETHREMITTKLTSEPTGP